MYQRTSQRIDEHMCARQAELYEPLRRSLLKRNMSQSNISSYSNLSMSKANDLSSSRVSRRMRSLSPEELDQIKNTTFVPITKRLVPTKNFDLVRDKRFQAIDVEERIHQPIPAIKFNSSNRFNINKVEQIVYQPEDNVNTSLYQRNYQPQPNSNNYQRDLRQPYIAQQSNIYTMRNNSINPGYNHSRNSNYFDVGVSEVREYIPRESQKYMNEIPKTLIDTFGNRRYQPQLQQHYNSYEKNATPQNRHLPPELFQRSPNNVTSFENAPAFNPSTLPIITSTGIQNDNIHSHQPVGSQLPLNLYTSQCDQQTRELPTQHTLSFVASPFGSRTSFEPQIQKPQSSLSRSYDFSKITQDSSGSNYKQKKQEEWKYNLFSIFDEPVNTKCSKTGCFNNEIIASRPNIYEWQQ